MNQRDSEGNAFPLCQNCGQGKDKHRTISLYCPDRRKGRHEDITYRAAETLSTMNKQQAKEKQASMTLEQLSGAFAKAKLNMEKAVGACCFELFQETGMVIESVELRTHPVMNSGNIRDMRPPVTGFRAESKAKANTASLIDELIATALEEQQCKPDE